MTGGLLAFDTAVERVLALGQPLPAEQVMIGAAAGRILAAELFARLTQPQADVSAMDGYALCFADLPGPLHVAGESAAGRPFSGALRPGEAVRIFTGAHLPEGADTVALQEDAVRAGDTVHFPADGPPHAGAHVRRRGQDFREGAPLGQAGARITPALLGLLAAGGLGQISVHQRPRVALLSTGDELVPAGTAPGPGQIVGSNALMLEALFAGEGADVVDLGIVADRRDALLDAVAAARGFDLLVTVGGASVGDHDLVKPVLEAAGARLDFWRVALQPGKPLMAGRMGDTLVLGLPGNPVSAFVCARLFGVPLVRRLAGDPFPTDRYLEARCATGLPATSTRRQFLRAVLDDGVVTPFDRQDSSLMAVLAGANALLVRPEHAPAVEAGATVHVLLLHDERGQT